MTPPVPTYTTIDLPPSPEGFEHIAQAADDEMWDVFIEDFAGEDDYAHFLDLTDHEDYS